MLVAATFSKGPVMLYFGQELGERGMDEEGFSGRDGRTTIFDYWTVNTVSRWRNGGSFDGQKLTPKEVELQQFYRNLLNICNDDPAITKGDFYDLMYVNPHTEHFNPHRHYAYLRHGERSTLLIVANFDTQPTSMQINIPQHAFKFFRMHPRKKIRAINLLTGEAVATSFTHEAPTCVDVPALGGVILKVTAR